MIAAGRQSNVQALNLEQVGIKQGKRGLILVDEDYRTNIPNIYAVGDVIGFPALASTSMEQARLAMVNAFDLKYKKEVAPILPYGIYTIPERRGRGIASAATAELCRLALQSGPVATLHVDRRNMPAIRAYRKAGLVRVGEFRLTFR